MPEVSNEFLRKASNVFTKLANTAAFLRAESYPEKALDCWFVLAKGDPSFEAGSYAYEIGLCYRDLGKIDEARRYFAIAIEQNPAVEEFREAARQEGLPVPPI